MSTEIRGHFGDERHVVLNHRGDVVFIALPHATNQCKDSAIKRADFLKAVVDELDVIVIERSELPEVTRDGDTIKVTGDCSWPASLAREHREAIEKGILANIALVEYLDANPPTDPKVEALATIIERHARAGMFSGQEQQDAFAALELARQVIATGRVEVTP